MQTKRIGEILREEREKNALLLEEFAKKTRIRTEYLVALENNEFDRLPAATFVKGYIKTYARELEFDHEPLLALLRRDYKESARGILVPREFLKPVIKKQPFFTRISLLMLSAIVGFLALLGYVAFQWYNLQKPPELVVFSPKDGQVVSGEVVVQGRTLEESLLTINGQPTVLQSDGSFEQVVSLEKQGVSTLSLEARDKQGKVSKKYITVYVQF